jgi:DNA-binding response OmpR family regulator
MRQGRGLNILLVEDDAAIASGLVYALEQEGYTVTHYSSVAETLSGTGTGTETTGATGAADNITPAGTANTVRQAGAGYALAIIDLGLPDGSGFDVAKTLDCPFLFLTAVDDEANTVHGFDLGADDYVTKPFRLLELLARIKTVIRRNSGGSSSRSSGGSIGESIVIAASEPQSTSKFQWIPGQARNDNGGENAVRVSEDARDESYLLTLGDILIDTKAARVTLGGAEVELTALEYKLLLVFAQHQGQTLSRAQLLNALWDSAGNFVEDNTLTVYVKRLREKLGEGVIETIRGLGYRCS